jgi:pilus assembly protein CpaE
MDNNLPKTRVLVIGERPDMLAGLMQKLEKHPYMEAVEDVVHPENALDSRLVPTSASPDVVVIAADRATEAFFTLVERLLIRWPNALVVSIVPPIDADAIQQMLLNGVRAVLPFSWGSDKILESLRRLHVQEWRRLQGVAGKRSIEKSRGQVIAVTGTKGGVGRTFLAVNLSVALHKVSNSRVALVDADWGDVDVSLYMNLVSRYNAADLLSHFEEMDDSLLSGVLTPHSSGVEVLAAPKKPFGLPPIPQGFFSRLFSLLRSRFAYIVVDTGSRLDELTTRVVEHSDTLLLLTTPDVASMQQASLFMETLHSWKYPEDRVRLVINRAKYPGGVPEKDIRSFLGIEPVAVLPESTDDAMISVNKGIPLSQSDSGALAKEIKKLARVLVEGGSASTSSGSKTKESRKILPLERHGKGQMVSQLFGLLGHAWGR